MSVRRLIGVTLSMLMVVVLNAQKPNSYNLKVGQEFTLDVKIEANTEQDVMGQKQVIRQTVNNVDKYEVVSKDDNGYRLKVTGVRRKVIMNGAGMNVDMDSDQDSEEHLAMRALTGKVYHMNIDKFGKVIDIEDFDEYKDQVKEDFKGTSLLGQIDQILATVSKENAITTFESFFYIYSPIGEKEWQNTYKVILGGLPVNITLDYSRSGTKEMLANGKLELTGDIEMQGMKMQAELEGTQVTTFQLDKKTGLSKSVDMAQEISGKMMMQSISVPMSIKTKSVATVTW